MSRASERGIRVTLFLAVVFVLLGLYLPTSARGLTWANFGVDGGDLAAAAATLGIPHPPGYPTYTLLAHLFVRVLPFEPVLGTTLLSVLSSALAGGFLALLVLEKAPGREGVRWLAGLVTGLTFGLAPIPWSQAVITEVHGLNLLFTVAALWLVARLAPLERRPGWLEAGLALILGLGLGNHLTLAFMLVPLFGIGIRRWRRCPAGKTRLFALAGATLLGSLVYLYLPLRAMADPPIRWGAPTDWEGFLWMLTARPYQGLAFAFPVAEVPRRVAAWGVLLRQAFGLVGIALGVVGIFYGRSRQRALEATAGWMLLAYSVFAIGYNTADSLEYLIPAHLAYAWFLALGVSTASAWLRTSLPPRIAFSWLLVPALALGGLAWRLPGTFRQVDASQDGRAQLYAEQAMAEAPEGAVILAWQALDAFPLWYYQHALGRRPDVRVIVVPLLQFDWYQEHLRVVYPDLTLPDVDSLLLLSPDAPSPPEFWQRPVCYPEMQPGTTVELRLKCPDARAGDGS